MASPSSSAPPSIPGSGKTRSGEFSARRIWAKSRQAIQPENEIRASSDSGGSDKFKLKRDGHGSFSTISFEILERIRLGRKSSQKRIDASSTRQSEAASGAPSPESSTCVWPATGVHSNSRSSVSVSEQAFERSVMRRVRRKQQVGLRKHALMLLDEPNSSNAARTIHVIIPMTIMLSVATAIILSTYIDDEMREVLDSVQTYCHAVFALELVLRFVVQCQDLITFFEPLFVIDLLSGAVPPIMDIATRSSLLWGGSTLGSHDVIARTLRFFVLLRVLKLVRHYDGARALTKALQRSAPPLLAPLFFTGAGVLLFAGLICLIETEGKAGPDFDTIPEAMWFSVVTLTTLGYGDVVPETAGGRIATALGAVVAVLFMAMPLTIVGNNFAECWNEREALTVIMRLQEFIMLHGLHASDLHAIFEIFDRDGNGWLDMMEFKSVLEFLGLPVPPYKVRKLFRMFDKDGLNQIAVKEFCLSVFPNVHEDVFGFDATNPGSKHSHAERTMAHRALAGCTLAERTAFHGSTWSSSRSLRGDLADAKAEDKATHKLRKTSAHDTSEEPSLPRTSQAAASSSEDEKRTRLPARNLVVQSTDPCDPDFVKSCDFVTQKGAKRVQMDESVVDSPSRLRRNVETHAGHSETAVEKIGIDKNSRRRRMSATGRKDVLLEQITARERGLSELNPEEHRAFPFGDAASVLEEARKQSSVLSHPNEKPVAMADVMALMKSIASSLDDLNDRIRELQAVTLNPPNNVSIDADLITSDSKTPDVQKTPKGPQRRMSFSSLCRRSSSRPTRLKHSPSCSSCTSLEPLEAPLQAMSIDEQHD